MNAGLTQSRSISNLNLGIRRGKTLVELAKELERIQNSARDFIVPTTELSMYHDETVGPRVRFQSAAERGTEAFTLNHWAHSQLAEYTSIPKPYYDRLKAETPALLSLNVNHGLRRKDQQKQKNGKPESRMIRTIDGKVRGFLSSSYRRLDSYDLMNNVLPLMADKRLDVISADVGETRMYVKAVAPAIKAEIKAGDEVMYGLVVSSSDVGAGSVQINPFLYRQICSNGMISTLAFQELLSDRTKEMSDTAFYMTVRDVVMASMTPQVFEEQVDRIRKAAEDEIKSNNALGVVELAMRKVGVSGDKTRNNILAALATGNEGAGYTRWGLANSFTRAANAEDISYEESTELQKAGGAVIELNPSDWNQINAA